MACSGRCARDWSWRARQPWNPKISFRRIEEDTIARTVEKLFKELERLSQVGNDTLRPRLAALLTGDARGRVLAAVFESHKQLPSVDEDYRAYLRSELDAWSQANPRAVKILRSVDEALAVARPAITVTLVAGGWFLAGGPAAGHLATDALITGAITGGGEVLVRGAGEGVKQAAARLFRRLQARYAQRRADWLWSWLRQGVARGRVR